MKGRNFPEKFKEVEELLLCFLKLPVAALHYQEDRGYNTECNLRPAAPVCWALDLASSPQTNTKFKDKEYDV